MKRVTSRITSEDSRTRITLGGGAIIPIIEGGRRDRETEAGRVEGGRDRGGSEGGGGGGQPSLGGGQFDPPALCVEPLKGGKEGEHEGGGDIKGWDG